MLVAGTTRHKGDKQMSRIDTSIYESKYGKTVGLMVFWGDTIALVGLPIWSFFYGVSEFGVFASLVGSVIIAFVYSFIGGFFWWIFIFVMSLPMLIVGAIRTFILRKGDY